MDEYDTEWRYQTAAWVESLEEEDIEEDDKYVAVVWTEDAPPHLDYYYYY